MAQISEKRERDIVIVERGRGQVAWPPGIFIHGTDVVDRGLIVLFSVIFCYFSVLLRCLTPPEIFLLRPLLRYSFIHQGTSTRRQRGGDLFGFRVKLPPVSTIYPLIGIRAILLSALSKDTTSELAGLSSHYPSLC